MLAIAGVGLIAEIRLHGAPQALGREAGAIVLHGEGKRVAQAQKRDRDLCFRIARGVGYEVVKHAQNQRRIRLHLAFAAAFQREMQAAAQGFPLGSHLRAQRFHGNLCRGNGHLVQPRRLAHGSSVALQAGDVVVHYLKRLRHLLARQAVGKILPEKIAVSAQDGQRRAQVVGKGGLHLPPFFQHAPHFPAGTRKRRTHFFHRTQGPVHLVAIFQGDNGKIEVALGYAVRGLLDGAQGRFQLAAVKQYARNQHTDDEHHRIGKQRNRAVKVVKIVFLGGDEFKQAGGIVNLLVHHFPIDDNLRRPAVLIAIAQFPGVVKVVLQLSAYGCERQRDCQRHQHAHNFIHHKAPLERQPPQAPLACLYFTHL